MPIYEYDCPKCGRFEAMQGINEKPLKAKPECEEKGCPKKAVKVVSAAAFHLKGSGWYKTDYSSGSSSSTGSSKKTESSEKSEKTDKSEKKDASATEKTSTLKKRSDKGGGGGGCGSGCGCH